MARGKPHHLWYRHSDAVSALMPTPAPIVPEEFSLQQDEAMVSLFRRLQINLMGLKI